MLAKDLIATIEKIAPEYLADSWDNSGLQIGSRNRKVEKVLVSLDLDEKTMEKAIETSCDMVITHHPFFFKEMKCVETDSSRGRIVELAIKNNVTVYSAHTNLDVSSRGVNDLLAKKLNLRGACPIVKTHSDTLYKLAVYVPVEDADHVRATMAKAGAGSLGDYDSCSFTIRGMGRFKPGDGSDPHIGSQGKLEEVLEEKIEVVVGEAQKSEVIGAMMEVHPYEEVAYDVYRLENIGDSLGYGAVGSIDTVDLRSFSELAKQVLDCDYVKVYGNLDREISTVAVCGGSGASFIDAVSKRADVYLTGDIKYHDAQRAKEVGLALIDAGHFGTEKHVVKFLKDYLEEELEGKVSVESFTSDLSQHTLI